ncbi:hypothetical protein BKA70DRAFT_1230895 [Coprinopsis sp. MPI-PUGE-AT-0042]|nr:hypothetical protein BKA70DRAFT_1230895 [Coprinopsis sp. MPI-PUGE-AT-0042]
MSTNIDKTPTFTPRRPVDKPLTARRLLGRGNSVGIGQGTPTRGPSSSARQFRGSQGILAVDNLVTASSPIRFGLPFPSIPAEPAGGAGPPLLPSAPIGTGLHFDYSFRYSPFPAMSASEDLPSPIAESGSSNTRLSGVPSSSQAHLVANQSAFSPRTRVEVVNGKRRMSLNTSHSASVEEIPRSQGGISVSGTNTAESETGTIPRPLEFIEYHIPDSDDNVSTMENSNGSYGSSGTLSSANVPNRPLDIVTNRLHRIETVPSVSSANSVTALQTISLKNHLMLISLGVYNASTQSSPVSVLLHDVAHPGSGITPKELQAILRKCDICSKFAYILSEGKHRCDHLAEPIIDSPLFELQGYLSLYDEPLGISQSQLAKVFVQCYFCDRVLWRRKKANHVCPREARLDWPRSGVRVKRLDSSGFEPAIAQPRLAFMLKKAPLVLVEPVDEVEPLALKDPLLEVLTTTAGVVPEAPTPTVVPVLVVPTAPEGVTLVPVPPAELALKPYTSPLQCCRFPIDWTSQSLRLAPSWLYAHGKSHQRIRGADLRYTLGNAKILVLVYCGSDARLSPRYTETPVNLGFKIGPPSKPIIAALMSSGTSTASRAVRHCRTCREPMKGHPRGLICRGIKHLEELDSTTHPTSTPPDSISSALKEEEEEDNDSPPPVSLSAQQKRFTKSARTPKVKGIRFTFPRQSPTSVARSNTSPLERIPPTVEELTAFLLGVDRPIDPARVCFALSILEQLEDSPDGTDLPCNAEREGGVLRVLLEHHAPPAQQMAHRGATVSKVLWVVFTHLLASVIVTLSAAFLLAT